MIRSNNIDDRELTNDKLGDAIGGSNQVSCKRGFIYEDFKTNVLAGAALGAGAASGSTGATNIFVTRMNVFEYFILGAGQTILAPVLTADGLNVGLDQTSAEGLEISSGITSRCESAFTVGTSGAFRLSVKVKIEDASGVNPLVVGFRKAEAYNATIADYGDYAYIGIVGTSNPNLIKTVTEAAAGGATTTDTTDTWADGAAKTLTVKVSAAGAVTYQINGVAPTASVAFSFTAADVVIPFFRFLNAADVGGEVELQSWECGLDEEA